MKRRAFLAGVARFISLIVLAAQFAFGRVLARIRPKPWQSIELYAVDGAAMTEKYYKINVFVFRDISEIEGAVRLMPFVVRVQYYDISLTRFEKTFLKLKPVTTPVRHL